MPRPAGRGVLDPGGRWQMRSPQLLSCRQGSPDNLAASATPPGPPYSSQSAEPWEFSHHFSRQARNPPVADECCMRRVLHHMTVIDDQKLDVAPTNDHGVKRRWWWSWPIEPVQGGRRGDDQAIGDLVIEQTTDHRPQATRVTASRSEVVSSSSPLPMRTGCDWVTYWSMSLRGMTGAGRASRRAATPPGRPLETTSPGGGCGRVRAAVGSRQEAGFPSAARCLMFKRLMFV